MLAEHDDAVLTETLERIRRAELACVLYPPGTPEHARAVERLDRVTRQMRRLTALPGARDVEPPRDGSTDRSTDERGA